MRLTEFLTEGAGRATEFALSNAVAKLEARIESLEGINRVSLSVERDLLAKVRDFVKADDMMSAKETWASISDSTRRHVPNIQAIQDHLESDDDEFAFG